MGLPLISLITHFVCWNWKRGTNLSYFSLSLSLSFSGECGCRVPPHLNLWFRISSLLSRIHKTRGQAIPHDSGTGHCAMQARKQRPSGNSLCACRFGDSRLPQRPAFEFESPLGCDPGQALRRSGGLRLGTDPEKPETRGLVSALLLAQCRVPSQRMPGLPAVGRYLR